LTWDEGRKHIVNKSAKCMPLLTRRAKKQASWWQRLLYSTWDTPVTDVGLDIDLVEGSIKSIDKEAVNYDTRSGPRRVDANLIMLATGYRQLFPFLFSKSDEHPNATDDPLPAKHFILNPEEPRLAYIGFIRPNVGAIPPMAEMQAMWWCQKLEDKLDMACSDLDQTCYKLRESRLPYGVDYGYYMFALAREIGSVPSLLYWLFRSPPIFTTCAFGQAHVPIFRLQGPFSDPEAQKTCRHELFDVILSRPLLMNTVFVIEAACFGVINLVAALLERSSTRLKLSVGLGGLLVLLSRRPQYGALANGPLARLLA